MKKLQLPSIPGIKITRRSVLEAWSKGETEGRYIVKMVDGKILDYYDERTGKGESGERYIISETCQSRLRRYNPFDIGQREYLTKNYNFPRSQV